MSNGPSMLSGVHAPNKAITEADLDVMHKGAFDYVKLLHIDGCHHDVGDMNRILEVMPWARFIVRFPDTRTNEGRYKGAAEYALECAAVATPFIRANNSVWFQVGNEDNILWNKPEYGPWQYQEWARGVMLLLRDLLPGTILISSPLSWSPALWYKHEGNPYWVLNDWLAAYSFKDPAHGKEKSYLELFDLLGSNVYWQYEHQILDPSYGQSYDKIWELGGGKKAVVVLEYNTSIWEKRNPVTGERVYTPEQAREFMREHIPDWYRWVRAKKKVAVSCVFLVGGTPDWEGFQITDEEAYVISIVSHTHSRLSINGPIPI